MLGRAAYADPYLLAAVDQALYGANVTPPTRDEVLDQFLPYVERELARGVRLNAMTRHILGLYHGQPRARAFRRHLAENAHLDGAGIAVLEQARDIVSGGSYRPWPPSSAAAVTNLVMPGTPDLNFDPSLCPVMTNSICQHREARRLSPFGATVSCDRLWPGSDLERPGSGRCARNIRDRSRRIAASASPLRPRT